MIVTFTDTVRKYSEEMWKEAVILSESRHNDLSEIVSRTLTKIQESQELTEELKKEGTKILTEYAIFYDIQDNSDFVFDIISRCVDEGFDCVSLESFLASLPQSEIDSVVMSMKKCFYVPCTKKASTV